MPELSPTEPAPPRACAHCGAPQDAQQEICVECGTAAPPRNGSRLRTALRPLALAVFAILIVASAAYGLTADLGRNPDGVSRLAAAATTSTTPAAPAPAATTPEPAPPADPPAEPAQPEPAPAAAPPAEKPAEPAPSPPAPATPSPPAPATPSPPAAADPPAHHTHHNDPPVRARQHRHSSRPAWLKQGDQPYSATLHDPYGDGTDEHAATTGRAVDGKAATAWATADHPDGLAKPGVGLVLEASGYQSYSALGIQTATPGFSVSIYSTDQSDAPATGPDDGGWTLEATKASVAKQQRIALKGATAQPQYLLVWITKLPTGKRHAGLSEVSLLP